MRKVLAVTVVLLAQSLMLAAQDGSLKLDFAATVSSVPLISVLNPPESAVTFYVYGGKFHLGGTPLENQSGSFMHYRTGPILNQQAPFDYAAGVEFSAGGNFFLQDDGAGHAFCQTKKCVFSSGPGDGGGWVWSRLEEEVESDGTIRYIFRGELIGSYSDSLVSLKKVHAYFSQPILDSTHTFAVDGPQTIGGGVLEVVLTPQ